MTTPEPRAPKGAALTGKRNLEAAYNLSPMQQGMLFHSLYSPDSGVYCEQLTCTLGGALNISAFRQAWQAVIARHGVLRTAFAWKRQEKPVQAVYKEVDLPLTELDWRGQAAEDQEREFARYLAADRQRGFDPARAPLLRLALIRTADDAHRLVWTHHHILLDGWSMPVLLGEVFAFYDAFSRGQSFNPPAIRPYKDYIAWLQDQDPAAAEAFWRSTFANFTAPTPLMVDRATGRPSGPREQDARLDAQTTTVLTAMARREGLTLGTVVQGAWALLLGRYSGEDDIVFGATVSGRPVTLPGADKMVGLFINTLPVRVRLFPEAVAADWLKGLQAQLAEARQYEYAALVDIQTWSGAPRDMALFDSIVVFENYPVEETLQQQMGSLDIRDVKSFEQTNYPLTIVAGPGRELGVKISYEAARYDDATIDRMLQHLTTLLAALAQHPETTLRDLPMLTAAEEAQLLTRFNRAAQPFPTAGMCLHELFEAQAAATPAAVALLAPAVNDEAERTLTYAALNDRANAFAAVLRDAGVGHETLVGLYMQRSPLLLIGLFGILKAGGAYLPLDPTHPAERVRFMLADSGARIIVTDTASAPQLTADLAGVGALDGLHIVTVDWGTTGTDPATERAASVRVEPHHLAYVIYTSGSTGAPKGVMVEHRNVVNHASALMAETGLGPGDRVLQFVSLSFDAAGEEFYPTLFSGATLVTPTNGRDLAGAELPVYCERHGITVLHMPAAVWHTAVDDMSARGVRCKAPLRLLALGGDAPDPARLKAFTQALGRAIPFVNLYGPTETTITAALHRTSTDVGTLERIPIGRPLRNVTVYLLDREQRLTPIGAPGEIHIGGAGVARGYLNRPELTEGAFVANRWGPGRLYRTGDLARWNEDGNLEFLGRVDNQIKIRGFRVEPGEIEAALTALPGVREAVVTAQEGPDGGKRLVAYIVTAEPRAAEDSGPDAAEMRAALRRKLPEHMTPSAFVFLPALPLTATGKVDRRSLPRPEEAAAEGQRPVIAPRTPEEELLAGVFAHVLGLAAERVGAHDSFFDLGGHSLSATRLASRIREVFGVELPLRALFDAPTVAGIADQLAAARRAPGLDALPPVAPLPRDASGAPLTPPPLSFAQQRLWFLDQLDPGNLFYNIPTVVRLTGDLDLPALRNALNAIIARHEVLRTTFAARGGVPYQVIAPHFSLDAPVTDLTAWPTESREAEALRLAREELRTPFDLAAGPLLRARLLKLAADEHLAVLTVHHSVADGWSMSVLISELAAGYRAAQDGDGPALPALKVQYADFAAWQRQWLTGEGATDRSVRADAADAPLTPLEAQLAYWQTQLAGLPQRLDLPTDRPRPAVQSANGSTYTFTLPADLGRDLRRLSQQHGVTLFMTLLAGYQTLLARYSGQDDIAVGSAIANRTRAEVEPLIGFFVNTLVFRTRFDGAPTFKELLGRVRETALGAFAHQDLPFELLVDALQPERNLSHTPLFQAAFSWQNVPPAARDLPGLRLSPVDVDKGIAGYDMLLQMTETDTGIAAAWEYNADLFDRTTIARMAEHLQVLLAAAAANPATAVARLPLLTPAERQQILHDWNATETPYPETSFLALFDEWVARTPDAPAVEFTAEGGGERSTLTYVQLAARAEALAGRLMAAGVTRGSLVAITVERSLDLVVSILGVLRAGAAYVPLDPHYPPDRLAYMLADSGARVLLADNRAPDTGYWKLDTGSWILDPRSWKLDAGELQVIYMNELPASSFQLPASNSQLPASSFQLPASGSQLPHVTADDLAYCIYTSGSSGRPKGVLLRHRGLVNLALVHRRAFEMEPGQRVLQFAPFSFDASVWETVMALGNGATLVLTKQETLANGVTLMGLLRDAGITAVTLPPSLLAVLEPGDLPALQTVIAAGEPCTNAIVQRWGPRGGGSDRRFFNAYGPTETTVCATMHRCDPTAVWPFGGPPIGTALSNFRLYVVDANGEPQPIGAPGELLIGGPSLAAGYHARPELTAERFIVRTDLSEEAERLYRSGDLVRWLPDGNLAFLGRIDDQVKVRGFRIELGEVEAVLRQHPAVQDAAVAVRGDALVGYLVPHDAAAAPAAADVRGHLRGKLPEYMIPNRFVTLAAFPLSPAGKVDRKALPAPEAADRNAGADYVAPRTPLEAEIATLCAGLLGVPRVGMDDNFFELGGHSLLATQLIARIRDKHHVDVALRALFEHPTVAGLAEAVAAAQATHQAQTEQAAKIAEKLKMVQGLTPEQAKALLAAKRKS